MPKRAMLFGMLAVTAVALGSLLARSPGGQTVSAQDQLTAEVERRTLSTTIETTGTIEPEDEVLLSFGMSGTVSAIAVEVGDDVKAGDVLAQLDTRDLENQIARQEQSLIVQQAAYDQLIEPPTAREIAQAQANLASAQSQLAQAQTNLETASNNETINCSSMENASLELERASDAYADYVNDGYRLDATFIPDPESDAGDRLRTAQSNYNVAQAQCNETTPASQLEVSLSAAQASVDQAQAALDELLNGPTDDQIASAQAQLDSAQLQLEDARASMDNAIITAAFDGIIAEVQITRGQQVNANTVAIRLVDASQLHINVGVDELDIAQVTTGQSAVISPEALNGQAIDGIVTRIAPVSTVSDGVVTYEVRVDINVNTALPVRIGMTTDVEIVVGSLDGVLVVPTGAVQRDGQDEYVEVMNADNSTTRVSVVTGATIDGFTEVQGDLSEGLTVILPQRVSTETSSGLFPPPAGGN